jgi:hypothetical protein|tara:strand:+ start:54 stop:686 length:633 start_codon:yes stop_codon:yes gene_type:complete
MLKHVGRIASTKRKVIVAYKVLPGEPDDCVVVTTENLEAGDHDTLMKLVESSAGQQAEDLATVMMRTTLSDGGNMLARFHKTGKMIKVKTANVEMVPNRNTSIMLSELNEVIAQQRGVTVNDLAVKSKSGETTPLLNESDGPAITASEMAAAAPSVAPVADDGIMTDEVLAKKFRSDADRLSKEAAELRRQAEELVPTKKKAAVKKTASA